MSNINLKDMELFKVSIFGNGNPVNVVRFGLDKSLTQTNFYQNFINKLLETMPQLREAVDVTITWKDLMGHDVPVSNDNDMVKAMENMYSYEFDVYKFNVYIGGSKDSVNPAVRSTEEQAQFKVYAHWGNGSKPEVRRFGVDKSMVTSFVYITAKIQDVLPALKFKTFSVTWKDEEGDDVTISTDEEMMTALTSMNSIGLIKLNIYVKDNEMKKEQGDDVFVASLHIPSAAAQATDDDNSPEHFGVMCDGCDQTVYGFRYKCSVCPDFDLCSKCEYAGMHNEHCMVRIPVPFMPRNLIKDAIKGSRHFLKTVSARNDEDYTPGKRAKRDRSSEKKHHRHGHGSDRSGGHHRRKHISWLETFGSYLNEFANLAGDVGLDTNAEKKPEQSNGAQKQAEPSQTQQEQKPETAQENESTAPKCPVSQLRQLIEEYLQKTQAYARAQASNSDADAFVSEPNQTKQEQKPETATNLPKLVEFYLNNAQDYLNNAQASSSDASSHANQYAKLQELVQKYLQNAQGRAQVATSDASAHAFVDTNNASVNTNDDVEMDQGNRNNEDTSSSSSESNDDSAYKADDWTVIKEKELMDAMASAPLEPAPAPGFIPMGNLPQEFQERVKIDEGKSLYPPLNEATAVLDPKEVEAVASAPPETKPAAKVEVPQPTPPAPRMRHPIPHIDAALESMLSMGFTNDDGWLVQLLEKKNGDIAAVLDLLTPVVPKK